jgi:DNA polymerase-1
MAEKKLFLLDGHALVYRAHFAFISRPLINSKGMNTSAVTGFVRTLWDILVNQKPSHIAVSFDLSEKTFRNDMYPEYKANRDEQPEDIQIALPYVRKIVEGFNIPVVELQDFEADDVIGTLAHQAEKEGFDVYMVTPDKDYAQLVSDHVFMYKPSRQGNGVEVLDRKKVCEKWDIENVSQVIDVLGLQGDSVDNIPGIPGIGPKTAVKLLKAYGSVEGVIENSGELKGMQKERVEEFGEQAILSKKLATIRTDAPVSFDAERFKVEPYNRKALAEIFKELEFRSLAKSILGEEAREQRADLFTPLQGSKATDQGPADMLAAHSIAENTIEDIDHEYILVDTEEELNELLELLKQADEICFDTETTGLDAHQAEIVGMSFALESHKAWYVPVPRDETERDTLMAKFKPIFQDEDTVKIGQNLKYDALVLKWLGIELKGTYFDTMLVHYLLEPELRHGMDYLAETYLKYKPVSIESLIGKKGKKQLSMRDIPVEKVAKYAAEDADVTLQLKEHLEPWIEKEELMGLYKELEAPLIKVLIDMEYNGIKVDREYLEEYSKDLQGTIQEVEREIYKMAGANFNIASPKQVGDVLFGRMGIPYRWRKTKSGQYSTSEEKLAELEGDHEIVSKILKYRGLTKLKSTYVDALPPLINPKTGRIHSSFNQALAATGRLSSNNPNLQNIPIRTPEGRKVREAFIPRDDDFTLLAADYSQIELRLIADISKEEAMLEAFSTGQDIHRATAARVFEVPYDEVTDDQRRQAKTVNFSIIYGAGAQNLSRQLDISRQDASKLIDQYFKQYKGLRKYMDETVEFARKHGYVQTIMGRRRTRRDINSRNGMLRSTAERMAINTPIQGSAADMIKKAMIEIFTYFTKENVKSKLILQVHDELLFDIYRPELDNLKPVIIEKMVNALPNLEVPILVDAGTGQNWLEAH